MSFVSTQTPGEASLPALADNISSQLELMLADMLELRSLTGDRQARLDSLEQTVNNTETAVTDMLSIIDKLETEIEKSEKELSDVDAQYNQLLEEQDEVDTTGHQLYQRVSVQDTYLQEARQTDREQDMALTKARFLRDEMRDEFYKKQEELSIAQARLDEQNLNFFQQFEEMKGDVRRQRQETQPLIKELDDCDRATLNRINHFLESDNISESNVENTMRLKGFIEYIGRYRTVFDEVADLEFEVRASDRALEFGQSQVKAKLAKMEALEKELSDNVGVFGEGTNFLKSAPRCVDLANSGEMRRQMDTAGWSEDEEAEVEADTYFYHVGGFGLHRCGKVTDIRVDLEESDEQEAEADVDPVEEETRFEKDLEEDDRQKETEDEETPRDKEQTEQQEFVKIDMKKALLEKAAQAKAREAQDATTSSPKPTSLAMEGVTATEKHMSSIAQRGNVSLSRGSQSTFAKPTHRTELRATGSSAMYNSAAGGRKQKK